MKNSLKDLENIFSVELTVTSISESIRICPESEVETMSDIANFDSIYYLNGDKEHFVYDKWKSPKHNLLKHEEIISDSTPLLKAFELIVNHKRIFIKTEDQISRIATLSDLNKMPFRIWLFGLISVFEMSLRNLMKYVDWEHKISKNRLAKAQEVYNERLRRNLEIDLLECVQLGDLGTILVSTEIFEELMPNLSKTELKKSFKMINKIRDEIAHSNNHLSMTYEEILELTRFIIKIIKK